MKIPILTYHSIDASGSVVSTAPGAFRRQMESLAAGGFRVVALETIVDDLAAGRAPAPQTVALTFDDGFANFYTEAFPVLAAHGFGATVFLVTDYCGGHNDWGDRLPRLARSPLLAWREIKELARCGIEFGSHTRTHPDLTRVPRARAESELVESKRLIEDAVGREVKTFAYPYGRFDDEVKEQARRRFRAAVSTELGKATPASDLFALERLDTYYLANPRIFEALPSAFFDGYMGVRRALRGVKNFARARREAAPKPDTMR